MRVALHAEWTSIAGALHAEWTKLRTAGGTGGLLLRQRRLSRMAAARRIRSPGVRSNPADRRGLASHHSRPGRGFGQGPRGRLAVLPGGQIRPSGLRGGWFSRGRGGAGPRLMPGRLGPDLEVERSKNEERGQYRGGRAPDPDVPAHGPSKPARCQQAHDPPMPEPGSSTGGEAIPASVSAVTHRSRSSRATSNWRPGSVRATTRRRTKPTS